MAEKEVRLNRFEVVSLAKIFAVLGALWGISAGTAVALGLGTGAWSMGFGPMGALGFGIGGFLLTVIMGAAIFFLAGIVAAFLYNVIAGWIGGIRMTLDITD
ncbi:MAG: hypothetical protein NQU46_00405 [Methanolinea sp.]|nr:hypothetical protein [Methanolinea sp.]